MTTWVAQTIDWLNAYGPITWWAAFLLGVLITVWILNGWAAFRLRNARLAFVKQFANEHPCAGDADNLRATSRLLDKLKYHTCAEHLAQIADLLDAVPPETLASAPAKPEALTLIQRRSPGSIYPNRGGCYEEPSKG